MPFEELVGTVQIRLLEDAGVGAEYLLPQVVADRVVDRVAENCRQRQRQKQHMHIHRTDGGQRTSREQQRVAGQERRDHQPGFAEHDQEQEGVQPATVLTGQFPKMLVDVEKEREQVSQEIHEGNPVAGKVMKF